MAKLVGVTSLEYVPRPERTGLCQMPLCSNVHRYIVHFGTTSKRICFMCSKGMMWN